ncbi:tRNA preQ1(34) S-adenosylmethionine ribosyltransferase-isomerase QueA [bacterium]|nr:MAG: tRNA preQ1(34) S-adenosylmethionine ribosyltransferase-isomerase QueA [bacterium]RKZ15700.1 MAG: tRNA preQ1(34) S-adenosylmethionine ribosyltransferase-isomerase QueA [bacterium]
MTLSLDDYDFDLPEALIAQRPADVRAGSRLLVWPAAGPLQSMRFTDLPSLLREGDLLVLNDTRVFAARLYGVRVQGAGKVELLLVSGTGSKFEALVRPGRKLRPGSRVLLDGGVEVEVGDAVAPGLRRIEFPAGTDVMAHCRAFGHVPLPPYIKRADDSVDRERYQTVFARNEGSVAAPTAGLHFDSAMLGELERRGVQSATVTLHVGPGTFRPVEDEQLDAGELHPEWRSVSGSTISALQACRERGGRVIAVGTTVCRSLESIPEDTDAALSGQTRLMIAPGFRFRFTDVLITNFHLPRSSLLLLVAAFAGERWREAYAQAVSEGFRFYSYGDANWIEGTR